MTEITPTIVTKNKYELLDYIDVNGAKKQDWVAKLEPYKDLINPEIAISFLLDECRRNKEILNCTPQSVLNCLIQASQLGLKISSNFGYCYVAPFNNKKTQTKELTLMIGYKGMIEIMYRHPSIAKINTRIVYQNEIDAGKFQVQYGKDEFLHHIPSFTKKGGASLYYADVTFKDNTYKFAIISLEEAHEMKKKAKTDKFWGEHFDKMALKAAVRRLYETLAKTHKDQLPELPNEDPYIDSETGEINNKTATNSTDALVDSLSEFSSEILDLEAENVNNE